MKNESVLLVGTGPMADSYMEVLKELNVKTTVVGRGSESSKRFEDKFGIKPHLGGLSAYISNFGIEYNTNIIIATGTETLMPVLLQLINVGAKRILIEKPAALSIEELLTNKNKLESFSGQIFVAYNRRFYSSVIEAERLIEEDGGLLSLQFEFTEWAHKIEPLHKAEGVKGNWFFANSTHVIDLAFFLSGLPKEWSHYSKSGNLTWHDKTNFSGAGITDRGVVFSYIANWESAGRWSIELMTKKRRIYLKPLEGLFIQLLGTLPVIEHKFNTEFDQRFKPGIYNQVLEFLGEKTTRLLTIQDHIKITEDVYFKMIKN